MKTINHEIFYKCAFSFVSEVLPPGLQKPNSSPFPEDESFKSKAGECFYSSNVSVTKVVVSIFL